MAILIPSKNIYKKQNQPVIKNQITNVELSLKNVTNNTNLQDYFSAYTNGLVPIYETKVRFESLTTVSPYYTNVDITGKQYGDTTLYYTIKGEDTTGEGVFDSIFGTDSLFYKSFKKIPFEIQAKKMFSNVEKENLYGKIIVQMTSNKDIFTQINSTNNDINQAQYSLSQESETQNFTFVKKPWYKNYEIGEIDEDNIDSFPNEAKTYDTNKNIFVYFEEITRKNIKGNLYVPIATIYYEIGAKIDTNPFRKALISTSVNVTIKMSIGNLEETEIVINEDKGDFSIRGNGLLQYNNVKSSIVDDTPINETYYPILVNKIVESWNEGKETATILCDINDYYDENNLLAITTKSKNFLSLNHKNVTNQTIFGVNFSLVENNLIKINGTNSNIASGRTFVQLGSFSLPKGNYVFSGMVDGYASSGLTLETTTNKKIAENSPNPYNFTIEEQTDIEVWFAMENNATFENLIIEPKVILPMTFSITDEVIPMVYTFANQDKPISTYKDGSPKKFQVVGTKIFYDGAVWQELSLREI